MRGQLVAEWNDTRVRNGYVRYRLIKIDGGNIGVAHHIERCEEDLLGNECWIKVKVNDEQHALLSMAVEQHALLSMAVEKLAHEARLLRQDLEKTKSGGASASDAGVNWDRGLL